MFILELLSGPALVFDILWPRAESDPMPGSFNMRHVSVFHDKWLTAINNVPFI